MRFDVVSLFPEMFKALSQGVIGRAQQRGQVSLNLWNPRDYTEDVHRTVDDRPYGGGPGMVMKVAPLQAALEQARQQNPGARVVYLSPQGQPLKQDMLAEYAAEKGLVLLCGRYEGVDERLIEDMVDEEISIGDYVLSGGELPAMVLIDAVSRLIPGVLGHEDSAEQDSFSKGLLDCPHYTRPEVLNGKQVPQVLLSGNHAAIEQWRLQQALLRTRQRRPDLLASRELTEQERDLLEQHDLAQEAPDNGSNNHE
ncbi:MAG: tRNA (guanosine(37)-N1)-methyltransferase TrmD [Chromatiales bacterium]|jgi:tRNA (guanine37-N1)-methyltransferase